MKNAYYSVGFEEFLWSRRPKEILVPIYREIFADFDTPVSAFSKINTGSHAFLFESIEGGRKLGTLFVSWGVTLPWSFGNIKGEVITQQGRRRSRVPLKDNPLRAHPRKLWRAIDPFRSQGCLDLSEVLLDF